MGHTDFPYDPCFFQSNDAQSKKKIIDFIITCQKDNGGFTRVPEHQKVQSLLFTFDALRTLDALNSLKSIDAKKALEFVST
jgi:prenyltransferase beta subunit